MQSTKTLIAILALTVTTVTAVPTHGTDSPPSGSNVGHDMTVATATEQCGNSQLSCCDQVTSNGDSTTNSNGLLSGLLGNVLGGPGAGLLSGSGCSKIEVPVLAIPLSGVNCPNKPVCCKVGDNQQSGIVNVGTVLPCVALPVL